MSTQLRFTHEIGQTIFDDFHYPLINADAIPYAYDPSSHPNKRVRLATTGLHVDTGRASQLQCDSVRSAASLNGAFPVQPVENRGLRQELEPRSASVPPRNKPTRRKETEPVTQGSTFIQESFEFPEKQTWLKPRPRQRRGVMNSPDDTTLFPLPQSKAPEKGEALSLDKHADRIAALIAQKRRENDSKLFRERMSTQQRLHRGVDDQDRLIAASHDELRRKMELSAKGIFEEKPPDGKELEFVLVESSIPAVHESLPMDSVGTTGQPTLPEDYSSDDDVDTSGLQYSFESDFVEETPSTRTDDSDIDEEIVTAHAIEASVPLPQPNVSMTAPQKNYLHHSTDIETNLYQSQTSTTTQTQIHAISTSTHTVYPQSQLFFAQPRFANHRYNNPHIWDPLLTQQPAHQQWTSQMWQALPSALPPSYQAPPVLGSVDTPRPESQSLPASLPQQTQNPAYLQSIGMTQDFMHSVSDNYISCPPTFASIEIDNNVYNHGIAQPQAASNSLSAFDLPSESHPAASRSNVNIFTGQARENGIIGGNNNWAEPVGEKRKNMFSNRA